MLKILILILTAIFNIVLNVRQVNAIADPDSFPNNKFGVHILFTSELEKARELVNSNGGDWGYVTIPIQAGDKDLEKWQKFMDDCARLHIIPIIRIATENYYFNTAFWRKASEEDILDFANFLDSLIWPVKNRYVIIFNEVNRADEWEGSPNPSEYASLLSFAVSTFKSLSPDFFIISAGLDNAASNSNISLNQYDFMIQMDRHVPGIFGQIDGLGSHSYPNPAFSVAPWIATDKSISSFKYERELAFELSGKDLPVFITETGWSREKVSENQIAQYFSYAFESVWSDSKILAVTPFLLQAGTVPFSYFSILTSDGNQNEVSEALLRKEKVNGKPDINTASSSNLSSKHTVPFKIFSQKAQYESSSAKRILNVKPFLKWFLRL